MTIKQEFKQEARHKLLASLPLLIFSLYSRNILIRQENAKGEGMIIQCIKQYNRKKRIRLREHEVPDFTKQRRIEWKLRAKY